MKQALLFTLSFAALSLILTALWISGGNAIYSEWITPLANGIYDALGLQGHGTMRRARFINFVPFTALMLLTPRLSLRRRFGGLALGLLLISLSHIALNGSTIPIQTSNRLSRPAMLISDAMPFVLWFVFAREFVMEMMSKVRRHEEAKPDPTSASQEND